MADFQPVGIDHTVSRQSSKIRFKGRSNCFACALRQDMVLADISLEELVSFHAGIEDFSFDHHATIFEMGTPTQAVYCIRAGAVKMVRSDPSGGERIVRVLKKGDLAGLESAFAGHHEHAAVAVGEVRACRIPIPYLQHFLTKYASLQVRLFEKSQAALREAENWLAQLMGGAIPARTRVARLLLHLRVGDGDRVHRFRGADMAAILGTTPETVSRFISEFARQGLLVKEGNAATSDYFSCDIAALERISKEEG